MIGIKCRRLAWLCVLALIVVCIAIEWSETLSKNKQDSQYDQTAKTNPDLSLQYKNSPAAQVAQQPLFGVFANPFDILNCDTYRGNTDMPNQCKSARSGPPDKSSLSAAYFSEMLERGKKGDYGISVKLAQIAAKCARQKKESPDYPNRAAVGQESPDQANGIEIYQEDCSGLDDEKIREIAGQIDAAKQAGFAPAIVFDARANIDQSVTNISKAVVTGKEFAQAAEEEAKAIDSLQRLAMRGNLQAINALGDINNRAMAVPTDYLTGLSYRIISKQDWSRPLEIDKNSREIRGLPQEDISKVAVMAKGIYGQCCFGRNKQ